MARKRSSSRKSRRSSQQGGLSAGRTALGVIVLALAAIVYMFGVNKGNDTNNQNPTLGSLSPVQLSVSNTAVIPFSASDPDNDPLSASAVSSNQSAVTATVGTSSVTLTGIADGTSTVTVTIDDGNGGIASQSFVVTVGTGQGSSTGGGNTSTGVTEIPGGIDGGWYQLYFTDPTTNTTSGSPVETSLVAAIDRATTRINVAVFEMNDEPITQALVRAKQRNVNVRVVTDGENGLEDPESTFYELQAVNIPVNSDGSRGAYMHDKFFVFDDRYVWTGSTNVTVNGIYTNNNNAILIDSPQLAANYNAEFEELFAGQFGASSSASIPNPQIDINGSTILNVFESEGDVIPPLLQLINESNSIRFMAFSLTRDDLMQAMIQRDQAGADVAGIVENSSRRYAAPLFCGGLNVRTDGNPSTFHHKVFVFDGQIVFFGSFNFSNNAANSNDENVLIIYNQDIAQAFLREFDRDWTIAESRPASDFDC
jgi:HKD family nuclease